MILNLSTVLVALLAIPHLSWAAPLGNSLEKSDGRLDERTLTTGSRSDEISLLVKRGGASGTGGAGRTGGSSGSRKAKLRQKESKHQGHRSRLPKQLAKGNAFELDGHGFEIVKSLGKTGDGDTFIVNWSPKDRSFERPGAFTYGTRGVGRGAKKQHELQRKSDFIAPLDMLTQHGKLDTDPTEYITVTEWRGPGDLKGWMKQNRLHRSKTSKTILSTKGRSREIADYIMDISKGLAFVHKQGIAHGEVTPMTMLLNDLYSDGPEIELGDTRAQLTRFDLWAPEAVAKVKDGVPRYLPKGKLNSPGANTALPSSITDPGQALTANRGLHTQTSAE